MAIAWVSWTPLTTCRSDSYSRRTGNRGFNGCGRELLAAEVLALGMICIVIGGIG